MNQVSHEAFGAFLRELRSEKSLTQKQLAEKLFVSDKAVSKWERGLSMPEVSLLLPLAEVLGVSVTELLRAERMPQEAAFSAQQVEALVAETIQLTREERKEVERKQMLLRLPVLVGCAAIAAAEIGVLLMYGYPAGALLGDVGALAMLALVFGVWFGFFCRRTLPSFYDTNRLTAYYEGPMRMNIPGLYLNNSNWPHVAQACWVWSMVFLAAFPLLVLLLTTFAPGIWEKGQLAVTLICMFTIFPTLWIVGKKYE